MELNVSCSLGMPPKGEFVRFLFSHVHLKGQSYLFSKFYFFVHVPALDLYKNLCLAKGKDLIYDVHKL